MINENMNLLYKSNSNQLINSKIIFYSVTELEDFLINFPNYKKSFNGARTINYTCKSSNLKPNSLALIRNQNIKRNCTATLFYGYLKENNIWYLKRFNSHGKFCKYRYENSLDFNFKEIYEKAENTIQTKRNEKESKYLQTKIKKDIIFDFFTYFLSNKKDGILLKIGDFLIEKPQEFRYEIIFNQIMNKFLEKIHLGIKSYFGFNGINIFFIDSLNIINLIPEKIDNLIEFDIFSINPTCNKNKELFNFINSINLENFYISNLNNFNKIINKVYNFQLIKNFSILATTVSETYSLEYNFLNKNNNSISSIIEYNDLNIEGINFLFDLRNCKRMIFELKFYKRKSRDIKDIIEGKNEENYYKYSLQINSFNGADRREIVSFSSFEIENNNYLENVIENCLKNFINYCNIFIQNNNSNKDVFDPRINKKNFKEEFKEFFNEVTFLIPFDLKLIKILNKIQFPYFINTRSLTEYILILKEFDLKTKTIDEISFNNNFILIRNKIASYFDKLNNFKKEKENPNQLNQLRREILEYISYFEDDIIKTEIFKIPLESLFVTENFVTINNNNFTKKLYSLNNIPIINYDDIILEKLKEKNYQINLSQNSQLSFSTFFEFQWLFNCKNYEIEKELKRVESMEDLRKMKQSNYSTPLKISDLNFNIINKDNKLFIKINTDLRFIVRALAESIKAVPFYLPRNIYSKLLTELFQYEMKSRTEKFTESFILNNIENNFILQQIISNISYLCLNKKIKIFDIENNLINFDEIKDKLISIEIEFSNNFINSNLKTTKLEISQTKSNLLECSCNKFNVEFLPCFHLIVLISIFMDSHNSNSIHNLIYDYISPRYSLFNKKNLINLVGIGKFDSQKLGRPRK